MERSSAVAGAVLRPLAGFEQWFFGYGTRHPVLHSITAHLSHPGGPLTEEVLRGAAAELQAVHPLLAATVRDGQGGAVAEYVHTDVPVEVRVVEAGSDWRSVVAAEQIMPFERGTSPLWRISLWRLGADVTTIVLTFDHEITDGVGGVAVLRDLVDVLNGATLERRGVPVSQEELVARLGLERPQGGGGGSAPVDVGATVRPSGAELPEVTSAVLGPDLVATLRQVARDLGTTLQSVLVGAASAVFARAGRTPISVTTPVDLRRNLGIADDVALRVVPIRTIWTPAEPMTADSALQDAITATDAQLAAVRNPQVLASVAGAISSAAPADPEAAEYGMAAVSSRELMLTNLGVIELPTADPAAVSVIGMEGLAQSTHIDENVLGVVTFGGELHMTNVSESPVPGFLDQMMAFLVDLARTSGPSD